MRQSWNESQQLLPLTAVVNHGLLSNHWKQNRLQLEPEWEMAIGAAPAIRSALRDLWTTEADRVELYGTEASLEIAFIQPVLRILGWSFKYQTYLMGREPDYALFEREESYDAALASDHKSPEFWEHALLVADAKRWNQPLDRPTRASGVREFPPEQIEWYLDRSRCAFGILTNGRIWRLVPRELPPGARRFETYVEVDLPQLLGSLLAEPQAEFHSSDLEQLAEFILFFGPLGHGTVIPAPSFAQRAILGSSEYRLGVSDRLRDQVFEALRLTIQGLLEFESNELSADDIEHCRGNGLVFLYRLLFFLYAEDRELLPLRTNRTYRRNRSLFVHRQEIGTRLDRIASGLEVDYSNEDTGIWDALHDLCDLVDRGHGTYGVSAYNGGLFSPSRHPFLSEKKIADWYLSRVIDQLSRTIDPDIPDAGSFRVDYRDLAIEHLGNVYEGLLELRPRLADRQLILIQKRTGAKVVKKVHNALAEVPAGFRHLGIFCERGDVYFETDKGARHETGSYYTPEHIVAEIENAVLQPLCRKVHDDLAEEIQAAREELDGAVEPDSEALEIQLKALERDYDDRVLKLRVLDPAMGSGHFLLRAVQFLAEEIATSPYAADDAADDLGDDESLLTFWKRRVVENCIFGVDRNPLAVELAKVALWLETVSADQPLSFLDHHLRVGNSLVGARLDRLGTSPNAPQIVQNAVGDKFVTVLPRLLAPLAAIRDLPSASLEQVRRKIGLLERKVEPAIAPFTIIADLWCSALLLEDGVTVFRYEELLERLAGVAENPQALNRFANEVANESRSILEAVDGSVGRLIHWELEFSDVFYSPDGRRDDAGFDAVIGNPPYEVLAQREMTHDVSGLKAFVDAEATFKPSRVGKNNLYKLFICQAWQLLRDGGSMGFIVPMALLGDQQAYGIREMLLNHGTFRVFHSFPQKDHPARRVFRDAKLSTAVFTVDKVVDAGSFQLQQHPEDRVEKASPVLTLSSAEIRLYDASNLTIVSCTQEDWELAVAMMASGRMIRLGEYCEQSQGEINEKKLEQLLIEDPDGGPLVMRGSNVCRYAMRDASQGKPRYVDEDAYRRTLGHTRKAGHTRERRVGFQRSSPQNNYRRLIAAPIEPVTYCFDTVSYVPESGSRIPLEVVLAIINSSLCEWYFRLGSTNSKVNEYQFQNLPAPRLSVPDDTAPFFAPDGLRDLIAAGDWDGCREMIEPLLVSSPFDPQVTGFLTEVVDELVRVEGARGPVAKRRRAAFAPEAEPLQELVDWVLFRMAGFDDDQIHHVKSRLRDML